MGKLVWDAIGEHFYETGVNQAVLYPVSSTGTYPEGVAWNGVTSVSESPSGADANKLWADNINYLTLYGAEEFGATIEAYTYPDEFGECDGSVSVVPGVTIGQQPRKGFGFSYRTKVGNDTVGEDFAYKLHLVYGCRASPSDRGYETINDSPEAITFSWEVTTTPVAVAGHKPTAILTIDSRDFATEQAKAKLTAFEDILYGTDAADAVYTETADESYSASKTYYTLNEGVYSEFEGTSFAANTKYYELTTPAKTATTARLPLPDEVVRLLTV